MRKPTKPYMNVLTGDKISEEDYNNLSKIDQSEYDKVSSVSKAKAEAVHFEDEEE